MFFSVCIPVYNGEKYLARCLDSVINQSFKDFEIIVVDDCSQGINEKGWNCKKICKNFRKQYKCVIKYLRNSKNMGCIEARRKAVYEAEGEYIFCLDCDDAIEPDCFEKLYFEVKKADADILQFGAKAVFADSRQGKEYSQLELSNLDNMDNKANMLYEGVLNNFDVFNFSVINQKINYFVWGKIIRRSVFISAWELIPPCYCVWGEDYVIYFFVAYFAKKYVGITDKLYVYSVDTGISSNQCIDTMERWEKICSVASAFTIIFASIREGLIEVTEDQRSAIQRQCNTYVLSTFRYLKYFVSENIRDEAFNLFCEYWGQEYVQNILNATNEKL